MSELSLKGKLIKDFGIIEVSEKFKKREFVIQTEDEKYPQEVKFQLVQDKTDFLDNYKQDEVLTVHFNIRGNAWKDNWFVNLDAWRLEKSNSDRKNSEAVNKVQNSAVKISSTPPVEDDDLPF